MLLSIITFLIVLGVIVFVHEIGHFYTAIKLGVGVEEFGFGFPPRIFGIRKKGILYSLNAIPLGGFVKIKGESGESHDSDSFLSQPVWKRAIILFAGVFMNWIFAFLLITIGYFIGLPTIIDSSDIKGANIRDEKVQVMYIYPDSQAYKNGFELGDYIISVDGKVFNKSADLQSYLKENIDNNFDFGVSRGEDNLNIKSDASLIPDYSQDEKVLGFGIVDSAVVSYKWYRAPIEGLKTTASVTYAIFDALYNVIKGIFQGKGSGDISGPVGVAVFTGKAVDRGFIYLLQFMALLSLNLGVLNALPFPALDGGRLLFLFIEKIRGKKVNERIENIIHNTGFSLLMILVVLVTYKDIIKFFFTK